jgi:uncharacterized protein YceH (UPF0502 family)
VPSSRIPRPLDPAEARVLGVLLEKELLTPDAYPLTLNAVAAAANQKTSRVPVMELAAAEVADALERLRQHVLVWRSEGARVEKWRQSVDRRWELDEAGRALTALLLLRGPQTPGELRTRSDRLHPFASVEEVEVALRRMAAIDEPVVAELSRRPGHKESRWAHLAGGEVGTTAAPGTAPAPSLAGGEPLAHRVERLEAEVARLREEMAALRGRS